ncbi:TonB-linked outer membrane protein, SusC/RagA family [Flavobacterium sp. CF108]|uniref:SusC/RagA family TonB-linked outer membrane protein n=1 Tax=unclassified Flavobacterium TaxID=196869 RepID=UPI0008D159B6|nr:MULTISPECIES: TonB-dependent receptor [unclassified Flavobacterium]SEO98301.1 TonB-linked outer membrane protein, SusC/RagA family [Flavobacterium sp. fv08]SHH79963.1 TonB-linked outer membrane protein, SusC/RagA family [Flavobacterium sp. CF108]
MKTKITQILKQRYYLLFFFSLLLQQTYAQQQITITGKVVSAAGESIPFANVVIKNTKNGAVTDFDGTYKIAAAGNQTLVFSSQGYKTAEVAINNKSSINVTLEEDAMKLEEIVVVGYGSQQKKDLTGAVALVKATEIQKRQVTTIADGLQGLVTGVKVRGGGRPGQEANVEIRGLKNLQSANPLYVIDGVVTTANRDFNPNDIESIQVLKDASAAAIYGSRAANGVIIITTKKGKKGPLQVEVSAKTSFTSMPRYDLMGTEEFAKFNNQAYDNAGIPRQNLNMAVNTDWQDEVFRTGMMQDYNASFSGGSENSTFFMSGNYFGNEGTVVGTDFDRISFRVNSSGTKGIFSIGENIAISNSKTDEMSGEPIIDVYRLLPTIPVYDESNPGGYGYGKAGVANTFGTNPLALADFSNRINENFRVRGNIWSELKFAPWLKYRFNFGYDTSFDSYKFMRKLGNWTLNQPYEQSFINQNKGRSEMMLFENTLTFKKDFGKHSLTVLVGQTYQKDNYNQISGTKRNLLINPNTGQYFDVLDLGDQAEVGGFRETAALASYLGRLEYNYDNRYLFNAVIRRDGSSKFSDANKWGNFPSLSAGWRISNESFFKSEFIKDLKLRASYGELGSGNIKNYEYQGFINTFGAIVMGSGQVLYPSATQVRLANSELRWEKLKQTNVGLDLGVLNNDLRFTADYFIARTEDVLFGFPILMTTGSDEGNPISNAATVENKGFELELAYSKKINDFSFNASVNFTKINNKLVELGNGQNESFSGNTVTRQGNPVGMWYVLQTDGLFQSAEEVQNYKNADGKVIMPYAQPGDIRFKDVNGDGEINNKDKDIVGSPWPEFEMGLNAGAEYKGFDFSMNWIASHGATVYNGFRSVVDRFDDDSNYRRGIQPWTPENPNTDFPRIVKGTTLNSRGDSDRFLESGDFIRLKYIGFGYNLPQNVLKNSGITRARLTLSAQNVITISKYKGLDPEFTNSNIFERGVDNGAFPNLQTYSFGVEFGF